MSSWATEPDLIARSEASPENDARSYWPPPPDRNFVNISSDVPANVSFTLQPVSLSNCFTNDGSVYPSQLTTLSLPSPFALMSGPFAPPPLSLPPPHDAAIRASATTVITTETTSSALRLVDRPLFIRTPLLGCVDDTGVAALPSERHRLATKRLGVLEARPRILPDDHQLAASVERDYEAGDRAGVEAVADRSRCHTVSRRGRSLAVRDRDPLWPDRHRRDLAGPQVAAGIGPHLVPRAEAQPCDAVLDGLHLELEQVRD